MAIVPKTSVLQVRLDPAFSDRLRAVCSERGCTPAAAARELLEAFVLHAEEKARRLVISTAKRLKNSDPASVPLDAQKRAVRPPVASGGLSDRLRLEREAKRSRKKKREDRWLQD